MKMYSLYDYATSQYLSPFFADDDKHAKKILKLSLVPGSTLLLYPGDYILCLLGDFDVEQGIVTQGNKSELCRLSDLVPPSLYDNVLDGSVNK